MAFILLVNQLFRIMSTIIKFIYMFRSLMSFESQKNLGSFSIIIKINGRRKSAARKGGSSEQEIQQKNYDSQILVQI